MTDCYTSQQGRLPCTCAKPRRSCAELGVCQGRNPPCSDACHNPASVPGGLPAMRLNLDASPYAEIRELLLDGVYVVGALAALIFVIFALLGYWSRA